MVKQIVDTRQSIFIFYCDFIQFLVINAQFYRPVFLFYKKHMCIQKDTLGRIKPLSDNSYNCAVSSFNLAGAIQDGAIDIGAILGIKSITNSTSNSGGNPSNSSENTSKNWLTIDT